MKHMLYGICGLVLFLCFACQEPETLPAANPADSLNLSQRVFSYMHEWYLWNEDIPQIDTSGLYLQGDLASATALMDSLRKKENPLDRWSYIEKAATYDNYFNKGRYEGYGLSMSLDANDQLRVAYVYDDSPFGRAGVGRSWIITAINGTAVATLLNTQTFDAAFDNRTNTFDFLDDQGQPVTKTITRSEVGINSVLYKNTFEVNGQKVGYLVFNNFLNTSIAELEEAFAYFEQQDIQELILDLRYNGGGRIHVAQYIASNLLNNRGTGQTFLKYLFNQANSVQNQVVSFIEPDYSLNLERLVAITSRSTASSSELVINGIKPFMDVVLIGDNTYGKPVGSSPITYGDYTISAINFKTVNQLDQGEYYEGLPADALVPDDLSHNFGDPEEARLKEALYYLAHGTFSGISARTYSGEQSKSLPMTGFRLEIGAY